MDLDRATLHDLTSKCVLFAEEFADTPLHPYQQEIAYSVFEALIKGDGGELTVIVSRQAGKSQVLAQVIAAALVLLPRLAKIYPDSALKKYKRGLMVGTFAPVELQAETLFQRITDIFDTESALALLDDEDIDDKTISRDRLIKLSNCGSFCRMQTCNKRAKIESKSYHLIVVDEAQGADQYTVRKSLHPMLAYYNGVIVKVGTPDVVKGDFYEAIQRNKRKQTERGAQRRHHEFDWKHCARANDDYRKFVEQEIERMGEDSDEFRLCVAPETRVLTADLRYIPAGEVKEGMSLLGFDEFAPGKGQHRKFRETVVEAASVVRRPSYRLTLDDKTVITCSAEHLWLVTTAGRRTVWKNTESLVESDRIFKVADVWDEATGYGAGYLAAAFDGEGCISGTSHQTQQLTFAQNVNSMSERVKGLLTDYGYSYGVSKGRKCEHLYVKGGRASIMRFLGEFRPPRLLDNFDIEKLGSIGRHDHAGQDFRHPTILKKEFVGELDVVAFRTSTRTFVAEGLASHNSFKLEWLLDRGMFFTPELLEALGDKSMQTVKSYYQSPVLVGIDPARKIDSTVVTVVWVDWDRPDEFGFFHHRILNWLEIHGEKWEEQYFQVVDFLKNYNIYAVGVDSQGMGDVIVDRLTRLMPEAQVVPIASTLPEQAKRWKYLSELLQRGMLGWPAHAKTRETRNYKRFVQQATDLEKNYTGPHMIAAAPDTREAHDDYCDSLALACILSKDFSMPQVEVAQNPFFR